MNEHRAEEGLTDNERLEFLGDAVIDLAVSHRLMERFPTAREGDLSKMRAAVVDEQGLSEMARALDIGALLRLGRGEELTGGRKKASLLADAMEAIIAAVFVGGGLEPVLLIVDRFLGEAFARAAAGTLDRDYKTQLQELAQSRLRATPRYRVVAEHGPDHSKTFDVETDIKGDVVGRGAGRSKKDAEQAAAKLALDTLSRRFAAELAVGRGRARRARAARRGALRRDGRGRTARGEHAGGAEGEAPGGAARPREARSSRSEAPGAPCRPTGREGRRGPQGAQPQAVAAPAGPKVPRRDCAVSICPPRGAPLASRA